MIHHFRTCPILITGIVALIGLIAPAARADETPTTMPVPACVDLSDTVHWSTEGKTRDTVLGEIPPHAAPTSFTLTGCDPSIEVAPADAGKTVIWWNKVSKGLGIRSKVNAGTLWLDGGQMHVHWNDPDGAQVAIAAMQYACLDVLDENQVVVAAFQFVQPVTASLPVDQKKAVHLSLPADVAGRVVPTAVNLSQGWQAASAAIDGVIDLDGSEGEVQISYNAAAQTVSLTRPAMTRTDMEKQLADVEQSLATATNELITGENAGDESDAQLEKRKDQVNKLKDQRDHLAALLAKPARATDGSSLTGAIELVLPSGVCVATISLLPSSPRH